MISTKPEGSSNCPTAFTQDIKRMKELPYQVMLGAAVLCVRSREKGSCGRPWNIKKTCISFTKCMSFSMSIIYCSLFFLCRYDETAPTIEPAAKAMIIDGAQAASAKEMPLTALLSNAATGNAAQVAAKVIIAERNGLFLMFDIMFSPFLLIYESSFAGTCIMCMSFISRFYLCYLYIRSASRISTQKTKKHWFSIIHQNAMDTGRISRIYSYTKQKRVE